MNAWYIHFFHVLELYSHWYIHFNCIHIVDNYLTVVYNIDLLHIICNITTS